MVAPIGSEFLVNTTTAHEQWKPDVTALANGGYIVTWISVEAGFSNIDVKAQFFDASGAPVGSEISVWAGNGADFSYRPAVTVLTNGNVVVTWTDDSSMFPGHQQGEIAGQILNGSTGALIGSAFQINQFSPDAQQQVQVTALSSGGFVAIWRDHFSGTSISGRVFAADGAPSPQFTVASPSGGHSLEGPSLTALSNGSFVVSWTDANSGGTTHNVHTSVFDATSTLIATSSVSSSATKIADSSVAALSDGSHYVMVWVDQSSGTSELRGRIYDQTGVATTSAFNVAVDAVTHQDLTGDKFQPHVAALANGGFAVTYSSADDVQMQTFDSGGSPQSPVTTVNTVTANTQTDNAIAVSSGATFGAFSRALVVWSDGGNGNAGSGSDPGDIKARLFNVVTDITPPTLLGASPADDATSVTTNSNIVMTFSESVQLGSGTVALHLSSDNSVVAATALASGSTVTLHPTAPLQGNTGYYVTVDSSAVTDLAGNAFAGISSSTAENFTTSSDVSPPVVTSVSLPNAPLKIGSIGTITITVASDADQYALVSGNVNGFALSGLNKVNDTTYTASFTVAPGGSDRAATADIPISVVLRDSSSNQNAPYTTAISQNADAIDANRPVFVSATANASTLVLTYGEGLDANHTASAGTFSVIANGTPASVSAVTVNSVDHTVSLTLATAITNGQAVSVSYTDPSALDDTNAVQDIAGNDALSLSNISVTNITPTPTAPAPTSTPVVATDSFATSFYSVLTSPAPGVLANDSVNGGGLIAVSGVNGNSAGVGHSVAGRFGNLILNADGSFTYIPDLLKSTTGSVVDHFTYTDIANGQTASGSLDIILTGGNSTIHVDATVFGSTVHSTSAPGGAIYALYDAILGRVPDAVGLESWAAAMHAGLSIADIAQSLLNSPENLHSHPSQTDAAFVDGLFGSALHRPSDQAGHDFWVGQIAKGLSRGEVAADFALSNEHVASIQPALSAGVFTPDDSASTIARLYFGVLGRVPDAAGLSSFETLLSHGTWVVDIAQAMVGSQEFGHSYPNSTPDTFLNNLYANLLGRQPDDLGRAYWDNAIAHGTSEAYVAATVASTYEAKTHLAIYIESGHYLL